MKNINFYLNEAKIIEKNVHDGFTAMAHSKKILGETQYLYSDIPHPVFNCVIDARATSENTRETIIIIKEEYAKNNIPHCWWVSELSEPRDHANI